MWHIQATITREWLEVTERGTSRITLTKQIPTFYLNEDMQGIVSAEHAMEIVKQIIDPFGFGVVHGIAVKV